MKAKTILSAFVLAGCFITASVAPGLHARTAPPESPKILDTTLIFDEFGSGGWISLKVRVPLHGMVHSEVSENLVDWVAFGEPVFALQEVIDLLVPMADGAGRMFYRIGTAPVPVRLDLDGERVVLEVNEPTGWESFILPFIEQQTGEEIFLAEPHERDPVIQPGVYEGLTLEDLATSLNVPIWMPAFPEDDPRLADLFPDEPREQIGLLPDDMPGEGLMEQGWRGDEIVVRPVEASEDPPPARDPDMPLVTDIPDHPSGAPPELAPNYRDPGRHLRVGIELHSDGSFTPVFAYEVDGDALLDEAFPMPEIGSLVWVVRTPVGAPDTPENIYQIGVASDPFIERSYEPDFRGAHGAWPGDDALVRLPVPVPTVRDVEPLFEGLHLELYQLTRETEGSFLTPTSFLRSAGSFELRAVMDENDLLELLDETRRETAALVTPMGHTNSTMTQVHYSGPRSKKYNLVVIGDGFVDTEGSQGVFNDYVADELMSNMFGRDVHPEVLNAINVFRINTFSVQSGITTVDAEGNVITERDTALRYRYSGIWDRCWMERAPTEILPGFQVLPGTELLIQWYVNHHVPEADGVVVVLNVSGSGGCARSSHFVVTRTRPWSTIAHELGHFFAKLGDEYQCNQGASGCGSYSGDKPSAPNLDNTTVRSDLKWRQWVPSYRPLPTAEANIADEQRDVGAFPGAVLSMTRYWNGVFRPSWRGRMNDNTPTHNPVGYTRMRDNARPRQDADFRKSVAGDFDGDGLTDLVILDDRQLSLYLARIRDVGPDDPVKGSPPRVSRGVLDPTWYHTGPLWNASGNWVWISRSNDILVPGDFDGDGRTDLYVANLVDWGQPYLCMLKSFGDRFEPVRIYAGNLPGWQMSWGDEFFAADFNGNGQHDLMVYNGKTWSIPYFLMLRSTGTGLQYVRRYDQYLPNWEMGKNEKIHIGDFNGNGRDDLAIIDTDTWSQVHLRIYASTGSGLTLRDRYYGSIGTFWQNNRKDRLYALDFDGDGTTDLAIFNGFDWSRVYLGMLRVVDGKIVSIKLYNNETAHVPGWLMARHDRHWVADVNGDGRDDLVVFNGPSWSTNYLGIMRSTGGGNLHATWQGGKIGGWNLGTFDQFHVADFRGTGDWDDLFIHTKNWFGLLRSHSNHYRLEAIYPKWIHNHRWHSAGWW